MHKNYPIVVFLMGLTSCGKTSLAMNMQDKINIKIISVDSSLVYKNMNIGTSKPNREELIKYPHKLVNIRNTNENYSVANFYYDSLKEIKNAFLQGKIPLLVGGTMFYYKILLNGLIEFPKNKNILLKKFVNLYKMNNNFLYNKLFKIDPISAVKIGKNDVYRLARSLEIFYYTGNLRSNFFSKKKFPYQVIQFALIPKNKNILYNNIRNRLIRMLNLGFEEEVYTLFKKKILKLNFQAMRCIGYSQMWQFINKKITYDEMFNKIIISTRRLAKNQMTWLKSWKNINFLYSNDNKNSLKTIINVLNNYTIIN
ncbi:tRNA (adenosine(37)-N6)-dimethylallyltransferase MiaA [Buchnera aphidicola (Ceratoglyphina bambusae)]|uniref:tRNA (adenosine(37)-N6)-dimethylallyltransferase MiaA n=1 Tax=Buchnera aphidicola TaxID=9 RepID=UPI0031B881C9